MGSIEKINKKIWALWCKYCRELKDVKTPMMYPEFNGRSILFIGLNPSFSELSDKSHLFANYEDQQRDDFFSIPRDKYLTERENYKKYFNPLKNVTRQVTGFEQFDHIDIFMRRETDSKKLIKEIYTNRYGRILKPFWFEQLKLSKKLMEAAQPSCVVFLNTIAGAIFAFNLGSEVKLEPYGDDFPQMNKMTIGSEPIPVKFFKQLSGGGTRKEEKASLVEELKGIIPKN